MTSQHWRNWACPFGCSTAFDACRDLEDHLGSTHAEDLTAERVSYVSALSSRTDPSKVKGVCPICQKVNLTTINEYEFHIGHHLEQLALFALPAMSDIGEDYREMAKDETGDHQERQEIRLEIESKASGKSAEVNMDSIDHNKVYHKDAFIGPDPEVEVASDEEISTKLSRPQVDDQDKSDRQDREEIKTAEASESHLETPLDQGSQPHGVKDKGKSMYGGAELQSYRRDDQGSITTVGPPKSHGGSSTDSGYYSHSGWGGRSSSSRRSKYVHEKKWFCAWCHFGPLDWTDDTHCVECGRPRDQYCRVEYQTRKVRVT